MRLTTFILMISLLQVSASTFGQRFTMQKKNASLNEVFTEIRKQTGYFVIYADDKIDASVKLDINFKQTDLKDVLSFIGKRQDLQYTIDDKNISFKPKVPTFLERLAERWASIDVVGRVVDSEGKPLPGATVKVKTNGKGVSTDGRGNFHLKSVEEAAVLVVSYTGYISKEVKAEKDMGLIVLEVSLSKLDEVQVIAYGTTTRRLSTGNIGTVKAEDIEKQPVNNPLLALQGRVPGLFIEQVTGFAGTGVKVRIQGQNSIANGNDPLYVIDGIPFTSQLTSIISGTSTDANKIFGSSGGGGYSNPLSFINPSDIESIDILKDADATAIYGSRAANGAILITTKRGKPGDIRVNANLQNGLGSVGRKLKLMDAMQYLEMRKEAFLNDGKTLPAAGPYGDNDLNGNWDNSRNTDWQKELIGGTAQFTDIQGSVSGGSNNTTFLVGAGYHKEGNVFAGDFSDIKKSVHFNLNSASNNNRFKIQISGSFLDDNNRLPQIDLTGYALTLSPVAPNLFNAEGGLNWQPTPEGSSTFFQNPIQYLFSKFSNKTNNLIGNAIVSYEIINGLELKSSFGYNRLESSTLDYFTSDLLTPENKQYASFYPTNFGSSLLHSYSIEPQINYKRNLGKGNISVLLGMTIQQETRNASSIQAIGFNSDQVKTDINSATTLTPLASFGSIYKYNAIFGRITYNLENRYILNLTSRRDGSSRFGSENQFHNFGAIAGAWIFSEEKLIKNNFATISFGKIRLSYGATGSDQISDYRFLSLYSSIGGITAPYQGVNGFRPNNLTNPYLQWEETKKLQFGLDLGFFKDRILLNTNYSRNRSSNQLLQNALPIITGFPDVAANLPATVQNSGWEIMVTSTNLQQAKLKWSTSINLTIPKNKILAIEDYENSTLKFGYDIGEPINRQRLYHFAGVNPGTGLFQFQDKNGNVSSSVLAGTDDYIIINTDPKYYGGFQNTFEYEGFQLDVLFQFTKQIAQNYLFGGTILPAGNFNNGLVNEPTSQIDRWQKPGDIAKMQKYTTGFGTFTSANNAKNSDAAWSDASYIRLKNISLSWRLPQNWTKFLHLLNCKIFVQGQNLLTITNYYGLDPESKSSLTLPPLRVITMGLQIGL